MNRQEGFPNSYKRNEQINNKTQPLQDLSSHLELRYETTIITSDRNYNSKESWEAMKKLQQKQLLQDLTDTVYSIKYSRNLVCQS